MKRIYRMLVCMIIALTVFPLRIDAEETGTCGETMTWTLDDQGTLTLSGTGNMYEYNALSKPVPWRAFRADIRRVIISEGIAGISGHAFENCPSLSSLALPSTLREIREYAFSGCLLLQEVTVPEGVTSIGEASFAGTGLKRADLPASLASVGRNAFALNLLLQEIDYSGCKQDWQKIAVEEGNETLTELVQYLPYTLKERKWDENYLTAQAVFACPHHEEETVSVPGSISVRAEDKTVTLSAKAQYAGREYTDVKKINYEEELNAVSMYRLYNRNSGEHFYTSDVKERDTLISLGWKYEGIGWLAPKTSDRPVFRLYNSYGGEHHYTVSQKERDTLISLGWTDEGIGWYSAGLHLVPVYREYNPNAFANNHNYTPDLIEHSILIQRHLWNDEGIAWYAVIGR